jgi:hypothetical protein
MNTLMHSTASISHWRGWAVVVVVVDVDVDVESDVESDVDGSLPGITGVS